MHIAIEGLDGAGKTSTAKLLAARLGFKFIEKPLHYLLDKEGMDNYLRVTGYINENCGKEITSAFYGLGNIYTADMAKEMNIITDRHLASNYYWNSDETNMQYYDYLVKQCGKPECSIILYAPSEVRYERIMSRNPEDPDLKCKAISNSQYDKLIEFMEKYKMQYSIVDNSNMNLDETVNCILKALKISGCIK